MARAVDQFRASDVSVWGVVALVCGGLAVLSANVSALIPNSVLAGLHVSRLDGGSLNQLRAQLDNLKIQTAEMRRDNAMLVARFNLKERADGEVTRRVGALEVSLPSILERIPPEGIDTTTTASIGNDGTMTFEADGGTVTVTQKPLLTPAPLAPPPELTASTAAQPMPELATSAAGSAFGLAIGPAITTATARATWETLNARIGALLLGLSPLVTINSEGAHLIAGPLPTRAEALALCARIDRAGIACTPVPFLGTPP